MPRPDVKNARVVKGMDFDGFKRQVIMNKEKTAGFDFCFSLDLATVFEESL